jgi:hypothetical protein
MIYLAVSIFIVVILIIFVIKHTYTEHFSPLDSQVPENNCYEFITEQLKWNIDHNIDQHLPQPPNSPEYIALERAKLIDARKNVLQQFDSVKSRSFSSINLDYPYTYACSLKPERKLNYDENNSCQFKGNILSYELDSKDGEWGRRLPKEKTVTAKDFASYISTNNIPHTNSEPLEHQFSPNTGCFIETYDKDSFFDKITNLAKMQMFKSENERNLAEADKNKYQKESAELKNTMAIYGIPSSPDIDTSLHSNCYVKETHRNHRGGNNYNFLDRHDVACGDQEVMSGFKLQFSGGDKMAYKYTCCRPSTFDGRIRPQVIDIKNTDEHQHKGEWNYPAKMGHEIACGDGYVNRFKLDTSYGKKKKQRDNCGRRVRVTTGDKDWYSYKCSQIKKQNENDMRSVNTSCVTKQTDLQPQEGGISNMQYMDVKCEDSYLKDFKIIEDDGKYGYSYTCCKPYLEVQNKV